jgi:dephospho-CoA kinase
MKLPNRPFLTAVTGGITSGKTTACNWLQEKGFVVYYSDEIVHMIMKNKEWIKKTILQNFSNVQSENGEIDRRKLGDLVFYDKEKLQILNKIIHPEVKVEIQKIIDNSTEKFLFFEIPLLVENSLQSCFDYTINIHSSFDLQIERLIKYRSMNQIKAGKIIYSQSDPEQRRQKTDLTIINNGELAALYEQLELFLKKLPTLPFKEVERLSEI